MKINLIAAVAMNNVIGNKGKIPWHLSEDLKRFKRLTMHKVVIMGRKTYESIGEALPNRINIIITSNPHYKVMTSGTKVGKFIVACSLENAINKAEYLEKEVFIIGGARLYKEALNTLDLHKLYITEIKLICDGDVFFPKLPEGKYYKKIIDCRRSKDFDYNFVTYMEENRSKSRE